MKYYLDIIFKEKVRFKFYQVTYLAMVPSAIYQEKIDSWNQQLIPNPYIPKEVIILCNLERQAIE